MNEKNPEGPSVVLHLEISHHYAQVPIIAVKIISNMLYRNKKKDILEKIRYGNFSI
jgi:hypothetical protein